MAKAKERWYVPDPDKAQYPEKNREKALLAGFRTAWANKGHATIISTANKLPGETLQEDEKPPTLYDLALT